jgi:hypothetical protein
LFLRYESNKQIDEIVILEYKDDVCKMFRLTKRGNKVMPTYNEVMKLIQETNQGIAELRKSQKETDRQIKQTNKQLGELGNRWGLYTEGLAYPSLEKVLREKFKMTFVFQRAHSKQKGHNLELDIFGYANDDVNAAVIVKIKSRLTEEDLQQLLDTLKEFPKAFPNHADKKLYGIMAAVNIAENMKQRVLKQGIYLAQINDETFRLTVPRNFVPKNFGKEPKQKTRKVA